MKCRPTFGEAESMEDDAHRVTFAASAFESQCWGSGTTGRGCERQVTTPVGLCDACHDAISRRVEERRPAPGQGRIVEIDMEIDCTGGAVSRLTFREL